MRATLVTAIVLGTLVPAALAEGEGRPESAKGFRHGMVEGQGHRDRREHEGRGRPPLGKPGEMFRSMDKDRDGSITREEFFSGSRLARLPEGKREAIFGRLDQDSDGVISREEIRRMRRDNDRKRRDEFRTLDENNSGGLDFAEFGKGEFFGKLPEERRRRIFTRMDTDGSGEITADDRPQPPSRHGDGRRRKDLR